MPHSETSLGMIRLRTERALPGQGKSLQCIRRPPCYLNGGAEESKRLQSREAMPLLNSVFYTFSTIAQALAGAIALLGAFVLFRLQSLKTEIDKDAYSIAVPLEMMSIPRAMMHYRDENFRNLLELVAQHPIQAGMNQALRERERLPILLNRRDLLISLFKRAFYLTLSLIVFSVIALVLAEAIASSQWTAISVFAIGILWLLACVRSYILLMNESLK